MPLTQRKVRQQEPDTDDNSFMPRSRNEDQKTTTLQPAKESIHRPKRELFRLSFILQKIQASPYFSYTSLMLTFGMLIFFVHMVRIGSAERDHLIDKDIPVGMSQDGILRTNTRIHERKRPEFNDYTPLKIRGFEQKSKQGKVSPFQKSPEPKIVSPNPHFGGLNLNFLAEVPDTKEGSWARKIHLDQEEAMSGHVYKKENFEKHWRYYDKYYAFDDDIVRNDKFNDEENFCRRVSWHRLYNPNCNTIHETQVVPLEESPNRFLGSGSYRAAFFLGSIEDPELVIKVQRFGDSLYHTDRFEFVRMDALTMERLTSSDRIVDIYGHCAVTVLTEFLPTELDVTAVPIQRRVRQDRTIKAQKRSQETKPLNQLGDVEKLDISLQMAEAIADLHGFKDGVLVHDDIQLPQFLFAKNNKIKLNDFNRGEAMLYNEKKGEYCRYRNGDGGGDWRAPEEYADKPLNEKIDVWSFGNNVYSVLTGLFVYYSALDADMKTDYKHIKKIILEGELTPIDPAYRSRSFIEGKLVEIIEKCWTHEPDKRPSIFEIVKELRAVKMEYEMRNTNFH